MASGPPVDLPSAHSMFDCPPQSHTSPTSTSAIVSVFFPRTVSTRGSALASSGSSPPATSRSRRRRRFLLARKLDRHLLTGSPCPTPAPAPRAATRGDRKEPRQLNLAPRDRQQGKAMNENGSEERVGSHGVLEKRRGRRPACAFRGERGPRRSFRQLVAQLGVHPAESPQRGLKNLAKPFLRKPVSSSWSPVQSSPSISRVNAT